MSLPEIDWKYKNGLWLSGEWAIEVDEKGYYNVRGVVEGKEISVTQFTFFSSAEEFCKKCQKDSNYYTKFLSIKKAVGGP